MSDNRKYYYMRIKEDFYDSEEIKLLQAMNEGYLFSDILMKMYLKSLKNEGRLMFKEHIPYDDKMIATITGHSNSVVEKALVIFQQLGLIEVLDSGAIYMLDIQAYIGKSSTEADRIKAYRKRIKDEKNKEKLYLEQKNDNGVQMYDECTPEIEREKDIKKDIKKEIKLEREIKIKNKEQLSSSLSDEFYNYVVNELGFTLSDYVINALEKDIKEFGELEVRNALEIASKKGKNYLYAKGILRTKTKEGKLNVKKGIKTFEDTKDSFLKDANEVIEEDYNF